MAEATISPCNRLIPAHEIAQMLGMSEASIANGMRDGKIPCVQVGQKRMMSQIQYHCWIMSLEADSGWYQEEVETTKAPTKAKAKKKAPLVVEDDPENDVALEAAAELVAPQDPSKDTAENVTPPTQAETAASSPF